MLADHEETLDVVDIHDTVIRQVNHAAIYDNLSQLNGYLRSVNLFLINSEGRLWIPRRAAHKKIKPNALDYSAGGHVAAGEMYEQAMIREIEEELGWHIQADDLVYFGKLPPDPVRDYYFCACFALFSNETPAFSPDEFVSAEWLAPAELLTRLRSGENAKSSILGALELWLGYQPQSGSHK